MNTLQGDDHRLNSYNTIKEGNIEYHHRWIPYKTFKAYDGLNHFFNLDYEMLSWKVHRALIKAKLEPYLGFLHSTQHGKPSLVCDVQELYRHYVDDFLIQYCQGLRQKDFVVKTE
jgi:CRISPR/Cas system-associated endonuclease Cas1